MVTVNDTIGTEERSDFRVEKHHLGLPKSVLFVNMSTWFAHYTLQGTLFVQWEYLSSLQSTLWPVLYWLMPRINILTTWILTKK